MSGAQEPDPLPHWSRTCSGLYFKHLKTKGTVYTNSLKSLLDRFGLDFRIFPGFCGILSTAELCHHPPD